MTRSHQPERLNVRALAQQGQPLVQATSLSNMKRLTQELIGPEPDFPVNWEASAEFRPGSAGEPDIWLHLKAQTSLPLSCQRCLTAVTTPLEVNQWYRFVENEDIAMAEDDQSEEDLLVLEPQFDLPALLEDELLMALPLVPMHEHCPSMPAGHGTGQGPEPELARGEKPNPFAALAQLKKKN